MVMLLPPDWAGAGFPWEAGRMGAEGVLQTLTPTQKLPTPAVRQKTHGKDDYQHDAGNQRFTQGNISS
jgi:hypothetical protein